MWSIYDADQCHLQKKTIKFPSWNEVCQRYVLFCLVCKVRWSWILKRLWCLSRRNALARTIFKHGVWIIFPVNFFFSIWLLSTHPRPFPFSEKKNCASTHWLHRGYLRFRREYLIYFISWGENFIFSRVGEILFIIYIFFSLRFNYFLFSPLPHSPPAGASMWHANVGCYYRQSR